MTTQPFSSPDENQKPITTKDTKEHKEVNQPSIDVSISSPALQQQDGWGPSICATRLMNTSLLDEPWKVTLIPAAAVGEDSHASKSLPWRVGDVTRLKDDSPRGMMEYIATHSAGWWREMAERALRDTEKAERMAREQGWQYGQYWALEVDAEAKQKLLEAEEARHVREKEARATEEAEKQAFVQRQMELLERAGRAPRCEYQYTDGRGCKAPQVRGERWCHGHAKMMSYRPEKLEILPMEDEQAVMVNLYRVTKSLLSGRITEKMAGLMLWSIAIGARGSRVIARDRNVIARDRKTKPKTFETQRNGGSGRTKKHSPQMNVDEKSTQHSALSSQHSGRQRNHKGRKTETTEPQRTRRKNKSLPPINTDKRGSEKQLANGNSQLANANSTPLKHRGRGGNGGDMCYSGVTNDKSFVSGVGVGSSPHFAEIARDGNSNTYHGGTETRRTGNRLNMAVDGEGWVVDNSRKAGVATQKPGLVRQITMPGKILSGVR